jgi:hypothetical protein
MELEILDKIASNAYRINSKKYNKNNTRFYDSNFFERKTLHEILSFFPFGLFCFVCWCPQHLLF